RERARAPSHRQAGLRRAAPSRRRAHRGRRLRSQGRLSRAFLPALGARRYGERDHGRTGDRGRGGRGVMIREAIYGALFAKVAAAAGFAPASRRLRHWSDVGPAEQPALFQVQKSETARREPGLPPKWTLALDLFVYAHAPDDATAAATVMSPLLD